MCLDAQSFILLMIMVIVSVVLYLPKCSAKRFEELANVDLGLYSSTYGIISVSLALLIFVTRETVAMRQNSAVQNASQYPSSP